MLTQAEQERILAESLVDRARRQMGMFTSILLLVSAVIIALIIYTMTMEKLRQIAMLKLIGAPDRTIVGMIVQQALALGLTGFAFGVLLIANIKDYFPRRVVLEPDNVLALEGAHVAGLGRSRRTADARLSRPEPRQAETRGLSSHLRRLVPAARIRGDDGPRGVRAGGHLHAARPRDQGQRRTAARARFLPRIDQAQQGRPGVTESGRGA